VLFDDQGLRRMPLGSGGACDAFDDRRASGNLAGGAVDGAYTLVGGVVDRDSSSRLRWP